MKQLIMTWAMGIIAAIASVGVIGFIYLCADLGERITRPLNK